MDARQVLPHSGHIVLGYASAMGTRSMPRCSHSFLIACLVMLQGVLAPNVRAQSEEAETETTSAPDGSTRQRTAAAEAYDRGTAAYLAGEYSRAAKWFETANRMAPAAPALMQAIRAHLNAGNAARAATLALALQRNYQEPESAQRYAQQVLDETSKDLLLIEVDCDSHCSIDVNGQLQDHPYVYVKPDGTHEVIAQFETGSVSRTVEGGAGEETQVAITAPPAPPPGEEMVAGAHSVDLDASPEGLAKLRTLPPVVTYVSAGVTAVLIGVSIWSWVDAKAGVESYEDLAAQCRASGDLSSAICGDAREALDTGNGKQTRSYIFTAAAGVAAIGTGVVALLFTDWKRGSSKDRQDLQAGVTPLPGGAAATVVGRF